MAKIISIIIKRYLLLNVSLDMSLKKVIIRMGFLIVLGLFQSSIAAQSNADYLKSLKGEAESITLDKQTEVQSSGDRVSNTVSSPETVVGSLISGLSIEQFEKVLQRNYIGSYLFYKRLSDSQKEEVYASYQGNPDPDSVRDKILKVSKK
jgi:hypothetical protein